MSPSEAARCPSRGLNLRAARGGAWRAGEEIGHLRIAHLMEIAIVEADRPEPDRRLQAHRLVDFLAQGRERIRRRKYRVPAGIDRPLIDTGQMLRAITYVIRSK